MPRFAASLFVACIFVNAAAAQENPRTENVIVVTLDGFRFQEFFGGADENLLNKQFGGVKEIEPLRQRYSAQNPRGTPIGPAAVLLGQNRQGGANLRRPLAQGTTPPNQRPQVFLSRL